MPMRERMRGVTMAGSKMMAGRGRFAAAVAGSGLAVILAAGILTLASPDRLLERSYARVAPQGTLLLDDATTSPLPVTQVAVTATPPAVSPAVVVDGEPVPTGILSEPLVAGDRVQFRGADARLRTIEVRAVAEMEAPIVGMPGVRLQLVTAHTTDRRRRETLQLIFAVREATPAKTVPVETPVAGKVL